MESDELNWQPISTIPQTAEEVIVKTKSGKEYKAHWACGGGEEQPYFRGIFYRTHNHFSEVPNPTHWRPL